MKSIKRRIKTGDPRLSWLAVYSISVTIVVVIMTILTVTIIIPNTNVLVTFVMMELGGLSFIMLAFVFTALFTKAKSAANAAGMLTSFIAMTYYIQGLDCSLMVSCSPLDFLGFSQEFLSTSEV